MPKYSAASLKKLRSVHPLLQILMMEVVREFDNTIVWGHRGKTAQDNYFRSGNSKLEWPNSPHNRTPSEAMDAAPFVGGKVVWESRQCYYFAGFVMAKADALHIPLRTGADWDGDRDVNDQTFRDVCHFELIKELI